MMGPIQVGFPRFVELFDECLYGVVPVTKTQKGPKIPPKQNRISQPTQTEEPIYMKPDNHKS